MVDLLNTLLKAFFVGQSTWASWSRKVISTVLLASLMFVGFETYVDYRKDLTNYQTLVERIKDDPYAFKEVKALMEQIDKAYPEIRSIWLYSWPDAHNLDVVHFVGHSENPIPLGHLWTTDSDDAGKLSMRICTELNRKAKNTACTVWGNDDAWGLLVVVWEDDAKRPNHHKEMISALAHRIGHKLYPHHSHD